VDGESTPVFRGDEADIDALVDKVAGRVYRSTQPYRYASWLSGHGRVRESNTVLQSIIDTGDARERAWACNGMAHNTIITGDVVRASAFTRKAIESDPRIVLPRTNLAGGEAYLGHDESALAVAKAALKAAVAGDPMMVETFLTQSILIMRLQIAEFAGDELDALDLARKRQAFNDLEGGREDEMVACALLHDLACFRAAAASLSPPIDAAVLLSQQAQMQQAYAALGLWDTVMKGGARVSRSLDEEYLHERCGEILGCAAARAGCGASGRDEACPRIDRRDAHGLCSLSAGSRRDRCDRAQLERRRVLVHAHERCGTINSLRRQRLGRDADAKAISTAPSRSLQPPTRKARTLPIRWRCGARL